ncbi:doublecortin domain-containing protein 1-like isoform X2 [Glandiceps talaboti]
MSRIREHHSMKYSESIGGTQPSHPQKLGRLNRTASDVISYEDLLIAQYLDELRKQPPPLSKKKTKEPKPISPYLQRLPHSTLFLIQQHQQQEQQTQKLRRPLSGTQSARPAPREKPKVDSKFIADTDKWDPDSGKSEEEGKEGEEKRKIRPASAPSRSKSHLRPTSAKSTTSTASRMSMRSAFSTTGGKRNRSFYRQPPIIKCVAYRNGQKDVCHEVSAPNIKMLLEHCTTKLGLNTAARRAFLSDGTEVLLASDIKRGADIYISCGEGFQDPLRSEKSSIAMKKTASWTVDGVVFDEDTKKKKTKPALSKRLRKMLAQKNRRVMVFKNGDGQEMSEVVVTMDKFDTFLDDSTNRLGLTVPAKTVYSWEGEVITDLKQVVKLDKCLQPSATPVLGPVWISKGEGFSPIGSRDFLKAVLAHCRQKIHAANEYRTQLDYAEDGEKEKITMTKVLSMDKDDIEKSRQEIDDSVGGFEAAMKKLKKILRRVNEMAKDEEAYGNEYRLQHIKQIDSTDRLVGQAGFKIKAYQNGRSDGEELLYVNMRELSRGTGGDKKFMMQRLLDQIGSRFGGACKPRRLFDKEGNDIESIEDLENDQEVWFSFGESFKSLHVYSMQLGLEKVKGYNLFGERNAIMRGMMTDDLHGKEKPSLWDTSISFPMIYEFEDVTMSMSQPHRENVLSNLKAQELDARGHFLQHKDDPNLVLYPEVSVEEKKKWNDKDLWPHHGQTWIINKSGVIYCKAFPSLALTATEYKISTPLPDKTEITGFSVSMQKKMVGNPAQEWGFSPEGFIYSLAQPSLVLTFIGDTSGETDPVIVGDSNRNYPGQRCYIAIVEKFPAKHSQAKRQRWAIKQETTSNMGQWKHSKVDNPVWNKLAYSWPVTEDGTWNEDFDWPMEGYFIARAPPLKKAGPKNAPNGVVPIRLRVLKNGDRDFRRAMNVVGPDLTNMMKDLNRTAMNGKHPHRRRKTQDGEEAEAEVTEAEAGKKLDLQKLEMQLFLDRCTSLLNLPFAARRVFDKDGKEHFTLAELERDQNVYVSCGEPWNDPKLSKSEQQRRFLLANLTSDVQQMKQYCALRNPTNLVMEVEGQLQPNSRIIIGMCSMTREERDVLERDKDKEPPKEEPPEEPEDPTGGLSESADTNFSSAHARAHMKSDERYESMKWPWERTGINTGIDEVEDANDADAEQYTNRELFKRFQLKTKSSSRKISSQRFTYQDGFIAMIDRPDLVLGVEDKELTEYSQVVLCKKRVDDINQRWILTQDGCLHSKNNYDIVLGVSMPFYKTGDSTIPSTYEGQPVTLQIHRTTKLGGANHKWKFDTTTGFIDAFSTDTVDKEVTSANKANVCTHAVLGHSSAEQPGYIMNLPNATRDTEATLFCVACAKAMRGYQKLEKLDVQVEFSCAMGTAKERGLRNVQGSFHCLNGKLDLSTFEAENTLRIWEEELTRLRTVTNARTIAKEIGAYQQVISVRILAHKNGEGRRHPGELIYGSSITGLLDQCTHRLGLNSAARRLYTEDGNLILSKDDLIQWAVENYMKLSKKQTKTEQMKTQDEEKAEKGSKAARPQSGHLQRRGSFGSSSDVKKEVSLHSVLRVPIEVWISSGEPFVKPQTVDKLRAVTSQHREERSGVSVELDKEKHVLRQMQGRRTHGMDHAELVPTMNTDNPVLVEGGWTQPTYQELKKVAQVEMLENHLHEMKEVQKKDDPSLTMTSLDVSSRLYKQSQMKRVYIYPNGENPQRALYGWGESMDQLLESATSRLNLRIPAKKFYSPDGLMVDNFEDIDKDQVLVVSSGEPFKDNTKYKLEIERKAEWGRIRKKEGKQATDITVSATKSAAVEVDPFGPPVLAVEANGEDPYNTGSQTNGGEDDPILTTQAPKPNRDF